MIRRRGGVSTDELSSSDEEDAFSALQSRATTEKAGRAKTKPVQAAVSTPSIVDNPPTTTAAPALPTVNTSSMKRHHGSSDSRKAKMDALLQELEAEKIASPSLPFVPQKKGSFVQAGQEHLTTNIFVGNLAPSITEEQMTDLFRQFGDLYSLKIMWPRTPEERNRNRNTGFVCFLNREDAEDAMDACSEADPFNVGRRLMMRWGKSVKMDVKRDTGGTMLYATKAGDNNSMPEGKRQRVGHVSSSSSLAARNEDDVTRSTYDPGVHGLDAIRVVAPRDPDRARFISSVASFVANDGSVFEKWLIQKETGNPVFNFLTLNGANERQQEEHVFYKWRVYSFCQGDGFERWRTEPFMMLAVNGRYWIPPPLDRAAALREEQTAIEREQMIRQQKSQRRRKMERKDYLTGRQLEQAKFGRASGGAADGGARMTDAEIAQFNSLAREKLCASRDAICEAMAFCFEKSGAAKQISEMLKELLLDDAAGVSVETRTARIYLLSDVLYNSQQPGVRNAFLYRDAIERMAPEVFASLGKYGDSGNIGRMTFLKLKTAVSSVLSAWTNWSVYNPAFIDELEARFEGRELPAPVEDAKQEDELEKQKSPHFVSEDPEGATGKAAGDEPQGNWTEVSEDPHEMAPWNEKRDTTLYQRTETQEATSVNHTTEREENVHADDDMDGEPLEDDMDGEPMEDDMDGESLEDDDVDGESLEDEDNAVQGPDDQKRHSDNLAEKSPADEDINGEALVDE